MANVCTNPTTIATDTPQGAAARAMLLSARKPSEDDEGVFLFDFNRLIPEPADLPVGPTIDVDGVPVRTMSDAKREWRCENWWVQWVGSYCEIVRDVPGVFGMVFETPWNVPVPVLQAVADRTGATIVDTWDVEDVALYRTIFAPGAEPVENLG